jgi:hypothetical protein
VKIGAGSEERIRDCTGIAVGFESEFVVAGTVRAAAATAENWGRFATGFFGPAGARTAGARSAAELLCAFCIGRASIVPIADEIAAAVDGAGDGEGAAGGGEETATALVCAWGACSGEVEVVTSVGVTIDGSSVVRLEVVAVRARERVHRLPFTVVIDSDGVAMQANGSLKETPTRAQGKRRKERYASAAGALSIST